ncbi:MAG: 1,4-alpha-glucan branching protein GlgB [Longimicrobiales bacterium]
MTLASEPLDPVDALLKGTCADPFSFLGQHPVEGGRRVIRVFFPSARSVAAVVGGSEVVLERVHPGGLFEGFVEADRHVPYTLVVDDAHGRRLEHEDPYRFGPFVDEGRVRDFLHGRERRVHEVLGARPARVDGVRGTRFAVWAPHARAVNLTGDINGWDGRRHPMRPRGATGVWELFVPGVDRGSRYKYQIVTPGGSRINKADPCGRAMELRPATASEVWDPEGFVWTDDAWMAARGSVDHDRTPMSAYEVHLGSWRRHPRSDLPDGAPGWLSYRELAETLLPYVRDLGFTHVQLLPVMEHPLDQSWGYQPLGFFAPTSRHGTPDDFRHFVDRAHALGLGVILDWVPGHFPADAHGLARFDGTSLFEHPDPRQARHPDWGTLVFDYGKPAVQSFLISSALHWLEDYHVDALRVDAVASMLYLDYSRNEGEWVPNEHGGKENLDAVAFLRALNDAVHEEVPGGLMVAEESTSWPGVSHGTDRGGLGFDQKWNMGWMNDTLDVLGIDPLHRKGSYERLTFSIMYAFSERFVLPLSHDEVVHGKGSLLGKMPGSTEAAKFANLRLLLAYQWLHPGKKLLFMGGELGQWSEWNVDSTLEWGLQEWPRHRGVGRLVEALNGLYTGDPAMHVQDFRPEGFEWIDCHDAERTILSFLRWSPEWNDFVVAVVNFTPVRRDDFLQAVPYAGRYRRVLNTDAEEFGGEGIEVAEVMETEEADLHGRDHAVRLSLPGLSVVVLKREGGAPPPE